jgi:predicted phage tail protein
MMNRQPGSLIARIVMRNVRSLPGFDHAGRVAVQVESIPDTGEAALAAPVAIGSVQVDLAGGTATVDLPPIQVGQVLRLTLQPLEGGIPDPPQAFVASVANTAVALRWEAPASGPLPSGYLLEAGSRPDSMDLLAQPLGNVTRFDAIAPRGIYYVRLRATNASGRSDPTASQRIDVGCSAAPGPPLGLRGAVTGNQVTLAWDRGAGIAERHQVEAGSGASLSNLAVVPVPSPATSLQALAPAGTYFIRVRAANDCGTGLPSTEIFLTVGVTTALPGPPGTPAATVSGSTVSLTWNAPAAGDTPTVYRLEAGTSPGLANAAMVTLGSTPAFAASGVPPGTYYVRVRAINQAGVGPPSGEATIAVP